MDGERRRWGEKEVRWLEPSAERRLAGGNREDEEEGASSSRSRSRSEEASESDGDGARAYDMCRVGRSRPAGQEVAAAAVGES